MIEKPVVLYVEDDPQSRKLMSMLLKGRMALPHVTILEDSTDFVEKINAMSPKPNIVFLDIHVKPHDGFEMLELLRKQEWSDGTPIVALTASVMNEEVHKLRTAGFDGCLAKPIDLSTFPDMMKQIISGETIWRILS
jgi:two-component system sensor histidine kinase BarA